MDLANFTNISFLSVLGASLVVAVIWSFAWLGKRRIGLVDGAFSLTVLASLLITLPTTATLLWAIAVALLVKYATQKQGEPAANWLAIMAGFAACIGGLSNSTGSPGHLPVELAAWLHISPEQAWGLVVAARKVVHFSAYGIGTVAAYRWSQANESPGVWRGIAFTLPLACFDEFRQSFAVGRLGSPLDVALDMAGAVTFLFAAWLVSRARDARTTQ